jgi:hypothetical protein
VREKEEEGKREKKKYKEERQEREQQGELSQEIRRLKVGRDREVGGPEPGNWRSPGRSASRLLDAI